jgi:hypothetical protein
MNKHPKKHIKIRAQVSFGRKSRTDFFCPSTHSTVLVQLDSSRSDIQNPRSPESSPFSSVSGLILTFSPHSEQKESSGSTFSPQLLQYISHHPRSTQTITEKSRYQSLKIDIIGFMKEEWLMNLIPN